MPNLCPIHRTIYRHSDSLGSDCSNVIVDPLENWSKTELPRRDRLHHELICGQGPHFEVKSVDQQECVRGSKSDSLVAIEERVIVGWRFHQRCGFLGDRVVVSDLRTENSGLKERCISNSMDTPVGVDLLVMYLQNFANGQVDPFGHLLCQLALQVPEFLVGATECFHHFRPHRTL